MTHIYLYLAIALVIFSPLLCSAEKEKLIIDVDQPSQMKMPIVIPDFPSDPGGVINGKDMAAVIRNNLNATGLFEIVEPPQGMEFLDPTSEAWKAGGAQALVTGKYTINGSEISMDLRLYDLALKKMELGKRYSGEAQSYRKILHVFSDRILERLTGALGCFSSKIAFVGAGRSRELFMMDYDGFNLAQLTQNKSINMSPDWAPNNSGLIFTSYLRRNPDLWRLDLDTLKQLPISSRPGINASARYSPDGSRIALSLSINSVPNIFIISPEGSIIKQLTSGRGNDISPAWSPDGAQLAYVSDQTGSPQIYTRPTAGGPGVRVSLQGSYNTDPDWSPKGDLIAYTTRVNGRFQVCTVKTDGSDYRTLTSVGSNEDPAWSPDGRMIAFVSTRNGAKHIYVMDAKGLVQTQVSRIPGKSPTWSRNFN